MLWLLCLQTLAQSLFAGAVAPKEAATILADGSVQPSSRQSQPPEGTLLQQESLGHAADLQNSSRISNSELRMSISSVLGFNPNENSGKCGALYTMDGTARRYLSACAPTKETMVWQSAIRGECEVWCFKTEQDLRAVQIYHVAGHRGMQLNACGTFTAALEYDGNSQPDTGTCLTFSFIQIGGSVGYYLKDSSIQPRYVGLRSDAVAASWDRWLKGQSPGAPIHGCSPGCGIQSDTPEPLDMHTWFAEEVGCGLSLCNGPVDCAWSAWSFWSTCDRTCQSGSRKRTREENPVQKWGGKPCEGESEERELCNQQGCPVDCVLSLWSSWSVCSKACDGGKLSRTRSRKTDAQFGGKACNLSVSEELPCNSQPCAVDCQMTAWSAWSSCSATCQSGTRTRNRTVKVKSAVGGSPCGGLDDTQLCNTLGCPQDCVLDAWTDWSECSATCLGVSERHRRIKVRPANGGVACPEDSEETLTENCGWEFCPPPPPAQDEAAVQQAVAAEPSDTEDDLIHLALRGHAHRRVGACMSLLLLVLLSTQAI